MNLYDFWKKETDGSFASGVDLVVRYCAGACPAPLLGRLMTAAAKGGYVGDYLEGKVENLLREAEAPAPPRPSPRGDGVHALSPIKNPGTFRQKDSAIQSAGLDRELPPPGRRVGVGPKTSAFARALHKQHSHHHALLVSATTDEERAHHAREIMERIIPALDAEYDRLRAGGDPDAAPIAPDATPAPGGTADLRALQTVRVRLSKLKKLIPQAPTLERRQKLEAEQIEKEAERDRLEKKLNDAAG